MTDPGLDDSSEAEAGLTVGAVARTLGIPVATLRSWNQRYHLGPSDRRPGSHRSYTPNDIAALERMVTLVRSGVSAANAATAARAAARAAAVPVPELGDVRAVLTAAEALRATELLALLTGHFARYGVADTWNQLCRPAFADLVTRQAGKEGLIDVEHVLSWAITTALHRTRPPVRDTRDHTPILLACTAGENHVLPLEILRAALAEIEIPALLLGASVPPSALADAVTRQNRPCVVTLWSQHARTADCAPELEPPPVLLLLAGPGWAGRPPCRGARRVHTLEDAVHRIERAVRPDTGERPADTPPTPPNEETCHE
ncbi:MAG TPA: MerR family transcriptional regulator [Nocardia sp.]|uniref:MerR family transcriptional regulator n=1 Tax=Nocardia sp. TaxID=1821 RepID=UPI002B4ABC5E|nr:MerR family transcriptional regulator [Nocardia sp.]HLS77867.1 MerR family transcriptional regulator [Nocardia sp.]